MKSEPVYTQQLFIQNIQTDFQHENLLRSNHQHCDPYKAAGRVMSVSITGCYATAKRLQYEILFCLLMMMMIIKMNMMIAVIVMILMSTMMIQNPPRSQISDSTTCV